MKKQLWKNILQFIVTIATSIISALGVTSCMGLYRKGSMKELEELDMEEEFTPRSIQYIVVHCSATCANIPFTEKQLLQRHLQRGFKK